MTTEGAALKPAIRWIEAEISRMSGRQYRIKFDQLDAESLREMQRLLRDLDLEKHMAVRRMQMTPWRRS
jgi:hypothetical protein